MVDWLTWPAELILSAGGIVASRFVTKDSSGNVYFCTKRTSQRDQPMSAFRGKADINSTRRDVLLRQNWTMRRRPAAVSRPSLARQ